MTALKKCLSKILILLSVIVIVNCSGEDEEKSFSIEEIQNENGIPVKVITIRETQFNKYLKFYADLKGIKQTTRGAAVGGRIDKINFRVGDLVKEDDIIVQFPTDNPAVQYEQAKQAFENSQKTFERMKALLDAGETSQASFDGAETKYLVDKRNYEMAQQALFIDSPYDGVLVELMVNEGDGVKSKDPLFTVAQLNKMKAKVWATAEEIQQIKIGNAAKIYYDGETLTGKVVNKSIAIDLMKRAFYAEVEFNNPNMKLRPGQIQEVEIAAYSNPAAIVVQKNLIMNDSAGSYLFVLENGKAVQKYVELGESTGIEVEIQKGLQEGEQLIVKGGSKISNGQKVNVVD
ncbi:MAG: efflux RND transporter periplasmic adaptor subunit [Melioribacteraceae bacterium]|nr:efflux RND transporter periplasmic adaptor subunit [Melioribacteraceae bacterium]MCF8356805.1 efflux RND transporter periplasmic adaptor subunit [Melioribacteraceae bacterium]MCF8394984.1 efflux RND transporter periplasmic adaptor subunit [Melioribacteraceae bacterium]MCF8419704.1 efflux RND transporter periplasmic adaptor subunit [Melioribacteraceae bacterium]